MDNDSHLRRLWLTAGSRKRWYGEDDPRTIMAAREYAEARADAAQAEADRLKALADAARDAEAAMVAS